MALEIMVLMPMQCDAAGSGECRSIQKGLLDGPGFILVAGAMRPVGNFKKSRVLEGCILISNKSYPIGDKG